MNDKLVYSKPAVTFRKVVPFKIRLVIGAMFWFVIVMPLYVISGAANGAKESWNIAVDEWRKTARR
jgi:hypothetical protein